jgi:hypothetical protein
MISKSKFANAFVFFPIVLAMWLSVTTAPAQTTSFVYQGWLSDGGAAANGNYDLQFALFDSLSGGAQVGSTQTLNTVAVSNGVFTVGLDFGANAFNGANRFLEISARPSGAGSFTLLTPRQQITSTPYAVRSTSAGNADTATNATNAATATNATQLGGIAASQYVQTNDSRLSDARSPTAGSANYIQNRTSQQSSTNFNIAGNGTAGGNLTGANLIANSSLGIATSSFARQPSLQIGADVNALFTLSPSDGSPNAGFIRFGDNTGWKLHIARNRESSVGALNSGTTGVLMTIQDNGRVGIGNDAPQARLDVRGDVKLGNTGQFFATSGEENLRIVRGVVDPNGNILAGSGFQVSHPSTGAYDITFNTPFFALPAFVATAIDTDFGNLTITIRIDGATNRTVSLSVYRDVTAGLPQHHSEGFHFIAVGPR